MVRCGDRRIMIAPSQICCFLGGGRDGEKSAGGNGLVALWWRPDD